MSGDSGVMLTAMSQIGGFEGPGRVRLRRCQGAGPCHRMAVSRAPAMSVDGRFEGVLAVSRDGRVILTIVSQNGDLEGPGCVTERQFREVRRFQRTAVSGSQKCHGRQFRGAPPCHRTAVSRGVAVSRDGSVGVPEVSGDGGVGGPGRVQGQWCRGELPCQGTEVSGSPAVSGDSGVTGNRRVGTAVSGGHSRVRGWRYKGPRLCQLMGVLRMSWPCQRKAVSRSLLCH